MPPVSKLKMLRRRACPRLRRLTIVSFILNVSLILCGCVTSPASDRLSGTQHVPATWRASLPDSAHVPVWNAWPSARNESGARRLRAPAGKPSHEENERGAKTPVARANLECVQALWNDARKLVAAEAAALITHHAPAGDNTRSLSKARHCLNPPNGRDKRLRFERPPLCVGTSPSVARPLPMETGATATPPGIPFP